MKQEQVAFIKDVFIKVGISEEDSTIAAESLTFANIRGIDSHGILRLPIYIERISKGLIENIPNYHIDKDEKGVLIIDAKNYIAQVVSRFAMNKTVEKAKENIIGITWVKNSNHFGAASEYTMIAANEGMIGITISNTVPLMPPPGGKEAVIGNNPLSISFPAGKYGVVSVDMAMSSVAQGKIRNAALNNKSVPFGWGIDKEGKDTTDPKEILDGGLLLPTGGPKGYGLAIAIEVLVAALTNSPISREVKSIYQLKEKLGISHMFVAINIESLVNIDDYNNRVETLVDIIKTCPKAFGVDEIYLPGEIEDKIMDNRLSEGMEISPELEESLNKMAANIGAKTIKSYIKN